MNSIVPFINPKNGNTLSEYDGYLVQEDSEKIAKFVDEIPQFVDLVNLC
jgi:hypothetical protein